MDFKNPEHNSRSLIEKIFHGQPEKVRTEAARIAERFTASPLFAQIRKAKRIFRELPFVLNERHGRIDGVIDLLFQDNDGCWCVVDYKTAVGDEAKVKAAGYDFQIALYALAAHEILGIVPRRGVLYFLKNEWSHEVRFDPESFQETAKKVREIQDLILEQK